MDKHYEDSLLDRLKLYAKKTLGDTYFHDYAHAIGVYNNVERLLSHGEEGDRLVLLTSALFHDKMRFRCGDHGDCAARYTKIFLADFEGFPSNKIEPVARVIHNHDKTQNTSDEKLFYDADKMDAFNELGIARTLMMCAQEKQTLMQASNSLLNVLDRFYSSLHTDTAKMLSEEDYEKTRAFALKLVENYK